MIGTWVGQIPFVQERLDVSKATIGLALLCMAIGAMIAMPLTGQVLDRRSSATVTRTAALIYLPLLAAAAVRADAGVPRAGARAVRRRQRGDGRVDERARRRGRAHAPAADHVVAARGLELRRPGRVGRRGAGRGARARPAHRGRDRERDPVGRRCRDHDPVGRRVRALRARVERLRDPLARRAADRRPVLPRDGHRGCDGRLERHLPQAGPRRRRVGRRDRLRRLLAGHGAGAARR